MQRKATSLLLTVAAALALTLVFASASFAATITPFEATYSFEAGYGPVHCVGKRVVSKAVPFGKDKEKCTSTTGQPLIGMTPGYVGKEFPLVGGGDYTQWSSDYDGKTTSNYTYKVGPKAKQFTIVAIYES